MRHRSQVPGCGMVEYVLKLYVTGKTARSQQAIVNLARICAEQLGDKYQLDVIDVLEFPQLAEDARIMATPTVVKELPLPMRRLIGDLSDSNAVLVGLELSRLDASSMTSTSRSVSVESP